MTEKPTEKLSVTLLEKGVVLDFPKKGRLKGFTQDSLLRRIQEQLWALDDDHHAVFSKWYNELIEWHFAELPKAPKKPTNDGPIAA